MTPARVRDLYIAAAGGEPMRSVPVVTAEAGRGIVGDRYCAGNGTHSELLTRRNNDDWQVTLIESEEIDRFLSESKEDFDYGDFRRNIVTVGVRLNALVGQRFTVDGIAMEGVRLCEPCAYLAGLLTQRLLPAMVGRSGLRARILTSGELAVGGTIEV
jgi:MOSC domain-containing protein YiiM